VEVEVEGTVTMAIPTATATTSTTAIPTATATTSTAPYSSEGPTLPILVPVEGGLNGVGIVGGVKGVTNGAGAQKQAGAKFEREERSRKKRRVDVDTIENNGNTTSDVPNGLHGKDLKVGVAINAKQDSSQKKGARSQNDNAPLYEPWALLPPSIRKAIEKKETNKSKPKNWQWLGHTIPIVYTRNQSIKSGVNRLKMLLGASSLPTITGEEREKVDRLQKGEGMVAVSAQGDAVGKLVSVVEMTRRVVGVVAPSGSGAGAGAGDGEAERERGEKWYMYTCLSSRRLEKPNHWKTHQKPGKSGQQAGMKTKEQPGGEEADKDRDVDGQRDEAGDEEMEEKEDEDGGEDEDQAFETIQQITDRDRSEQRKWIDVPVLTVWISKIQIKEFREGFGEQEFVVRRALEGVEGK
jgi:hypothetical protein